MKIIQGNRFRLEGRGSQAGFSLLEVLAGMVVLTIGLVGLLSVFGMAMASTQSSQMDLLAKQFANEAMESVFTARNTGQTKWDQIQNQGPPLTPGPGVFLTGQMAIRDTGNDGLIGTADNLAGPLKVSQIAVGAASKGTSLANFSREIAIAALPNRGDLRSITITIRYTVPPGLNKAYIMSGYISQYQ